VATKIVTTNSKKLVHRGARPAPGSLRRSASDVNLAIRSALAVKI
jgi:hypothetical protein